MSKTLLIDGDIFIHREATSCEQAVDFGEGWWGYYADLKEASAKLDVRMRYFKNLLNVDKVVVALSDIHNNWRKNVLSTYKENRKKGRKPVIFVPLRDYVIDTYKTTMIDTLEADDVLGILGTKEENSIILTVDKDLKTVPGQHFNPDKPDLGVYTISEEEANFNHLLQTLTGDSTDGYSGCPGIGPKRGERMLREDASWNTVINAYETAGLGEPEALIQARVARILRCSEYDTKKKCVNLWSPK